MLHLMVHLWLPGGEVCHFLCQCLLLRHCVHYIAKKSSPYMWTHDSWSQVSHLFASFVKWILTIQYAQAAATLYVDSLWITSKTYFLLTNTTLSDQSSYIWEIGKEIWLNCTVFTLLCQFKAAATTFFMGGHFPCADWTGQESNCFISCTNASRGKIQDAAELLTALRHWKDKPDKNLKTILKLMQHREEPPVQIIWKNENKRICFECGI